jgi:hypothetical protein
MGVFDGRNVKSWANAANESSQRKRKNRHATRRARGSSSRTPSPVQSPKSGNVRGQGEQMMIYTKKPIILASGHRVKGHWTRAVDPEGDYGGPYANMRNLLKNPRYRADMDEISRDRAAYKNFVERMKHQASSSRHQSVRTMGVTRRVPARRTRSSSRSRSHSR